MMPAAFPIGQFFSPDKYKETCHSNKALVPMYFIALGQPLEAVKKYIHVNETAGRQWDIHHPIWRVRPLHVAVWRQAADVVQYLLYEKKCKPVVQDALGFLPVHYAEALDNAEITEMIRSAMKIKYVSHRSVWDKLLARPLIPADAPVFAYINESGAIEKGNSEKFAELTGGALFTPTIFLRNRNGLLEMIAKALENAKEGLIMHQYGTQIVDELAASTPPLCLTKQGSAGWGVCATRDLEPFVPITIYGGEVMAKTEREKSHLSDNYFLDPIEAHRFRNLGGMINEGFPNCFIDANYHPSGIFFPVIVPIRPIAKDEALFIDYLSKHKIKRLRRSELNLDEARAFLKRGGLLRIGRDQLLPLIIEAKKKGNPTILGEMTALFSLFNYFINTTSLLIRLSFERLIPARELIILGSEEKYLPFFQNDIARQKAFKQMALFFEVFEKLDAKVKWDVFKEIQNQFAKISDSSSAETIYAAFMFLGSTYQDQLSWTIPIPQQSVELMIRNFIAAIPVFELTLTCIFRQSDVTDQELAVLETIGNGHSGIESIYLGLHSKANFDDYPKLKAFIAKRNEITSQAIGPEANIGRMAGMMRAMRPGELPPGAEVFINQLEGNPNMQAAFVKLMSEKKL